MVLWDDGARAFKRADPRSSAKMEQIVQELMAELRRRLGGRFTAQELADVYMEGTDWCFDVAINIAPEWPEAWDMPSLTGAAFARFVRQAMDFGGGRRRVEEDKE